MIKNIVIVGGLTLLIKLLAFYKETLVASIFGLSTLLDTFFIAVLIPGFIGNVFVSSLSNVFIPNYITELNEGGDKGPFQAMVFILVSGLMLFFVITTFLLSDVFVEFVFPGKDAAYYKLITDQLYYILPSLFLIGINAIVVGLLEIENKFLIANISSFMPPAAAIICLLFFKESMGDMVLAIGFLLGAISSFLYLSFMAKQYKIIHLGKPKINTNTKIMLQQFPSKAVAGFFGSSNSFVDQYFAAQLAVGSIAAINYGTKIPTFVMVILILAIGKVLLPHFSKLVAKDMHKGFNQLFKVLKSLFFGSMLICVAVFFLSDAIISLLFERGEFTGEDTYIVANIQKIIIIYVPFALCGVVLTKFLTTLNDNKYLAYVSFFNFILNIGLNIILINLYGLYGLAMATTCVMVLRSFIYFHRAYGKRPKPIEK